MDSARTLVIADAEKFDSVGSESIRAEGLIRCLVSLDESFCTVLLSSRSCCSRFEQPRSWAEGEHLSFDHQQKPIRVGTPIARDPIFVYNNWSAYDELSDNIPLTEHLAMKELDEILRLRRFGIRFDYYTIDAFWFDPDGGYRTWRKPNWPNGPDAWIRKCRENGILPGLWFSTNTLVKINAAPEWRDSLTEKKARCLSSRAAFCPVFHGHIAVLV